MRSGHVHTSAAVHSPSVAWFLLDFTCLFVGYWA
jgi:hypothetical protein